MWNRIKEWLKEQWAIPKKRPIIIILGLCCFVLLIGSFILFAVLIKRLVLTIIIPAILILVVCVFSCWDQLSANYYYNQQAQQVAEQQRAVAAQALYYELLRGIVLPILEIMTGRKIYEGLCIYAGPYLYGPGESGPIYYYEIMPELVDFGKNEKRKELRSRLKRAISKKYHMPIETARHCVAVGPGAGGMQLALICLDPTVFPNLNQQALSQKERGKN